MSDPAQHILTWQCGKDEDKKIRESLQVCYDRGKFKDLCQTASGVQFRARLKVVPPFLTELSRQHPDVCFTQEWASSSRTEAGRTVYIEGEQTEDHDLKDVKHYAHEVWKRARHTEAAMRFGYKIEANWQEYKRKMLALPKETLIDDAETIAATQFCREYLTSRMLSQDMRDYLQRFKNPLKVVRDAWLDGQNVDMTVEFDHVLWELRDRQDAEQDYAMEPEYEPGEPEQSM